MLRFLFPRLTARPPRGQALFDQSVAEARKPHWYVEGGVPDTLDGRFAMLTTICALMTVRLEAIADGGGAYPVAALSERFIEAMDAEHRQMGLSDPALGKRVRKMLGSLSRRVAIWREATAGRAGWDSTILSSVYRGEETDAAALAHSVAGLAQFWQRLQDSRDDRLLEGEV